MKAKVLVVVSAVAAVCSAAGIPCGNVALREVVRGPDAPADFIVKKGMRGSTYMSQFVLGSHRVYFPDVTFSWIACKQGKRFQEEK